MNKARLFLGAIVFASASAAFGQVSGSGTLNFLTKWNGPSTVGNSLLFDNGSRIGISTTTPKSMLHVGPGADTPLLNGTTLYVSDNGVTAIAAHDSANHVEVALGTAGLGGGQFAALVGTRTNHDLYFQANSNYFAILKANGNFGIGTTTPSGRLHVSGPSLNAYFTSTASATTGYSRVFVNNDAGRGLALLSYGSGFSGTSEFGGLPYADLNEIMSYGNSGFALSTNTATPLVLGTLDTERMRVTATGLVGIGTTTPQMLLDVGGWTGKPADVFGAGTSVAGDLFAGNTGAGIGRTRLSGNANEGFFQWNLYYNGTGLKLLDPTKPGFDVDLNGVADAISFRRFTPSAGLVTPQTLLVIAGSGNVGINTASPAATLDVNGNAHFSGTVTGGNIIAKYQDVAEWVPAGDALEDGTVVVIDAKRPNSVVASTAAYDTAVAGVVSPNPGITLGEPGPGKAKIATTGRVRVRADATSHAIALGDLLVTSNTPGVVMRSEPMTVNGRTFHQPGTIIGKALEPLPSGRGEILVLLTLQ